MKANTKRNTQGAALAAVPVPEQRPVETAATVLERGARDFDNERLDGMPAVRNMAERMHGILDDLDRVAHADPRAVVELEPVRRLVGAVAACLARQVVGTCCGGLLRDLYGGGDE